MRGVPKDPEVARKLNEGRSMRAKLRGFGKQSPSAATRDLLSKVRKGTTDSEETKEKKRVASIEINSRQEVKLQKSVRSSKNRWITNGVDEKLIIVGDIINECWYSGRKQSKLTGRTTKYKGKKYEEIFGEEKALIEKQNRSSSHIERLAGLTCATAVTVDASADRDSRVYTCWRLSVFNRDNYSCKRCKIRGGNLIAHHIKGWALFPLLRFELSNGMTLCVQCHKDIHREIVACKNLFTDFKNLYKRKK